MPKPATLLLSLAYCLLYTGCHKSTPTAQNPQGAGPSPAMPVVAVAAKQQPIVESVSLVGTITANEEVEIKAETDGIVEEILFEEGALVQKDQPLIRLDETELQAELADAESRLKLALTSFARSQQLYSEKLVSQQEFDQAESAFEVAKATVELRKRQLRDAHVNAPFKGRTGARSISPGQVITRNTPITWLVDLDPVKVEMNMPERFLGQTSLGQKVQFEVAAYPGERFEGEVYFVTPRLDLATRTALVKTRIPNPNGQLKAGMVANLELNLKTRSNALVIPEAAIIHNGDTTLVFVVNSNHTVRLQPVTLGQYLPRFVEIVSGLQPGDIVVVEGHQKIGPGMNVQLASPEKTAAYQN